MSHCFANTSPGIRWALPIAALMLLWTGPARAQTDDGPGAPVNESVRLKERATRFWEARVKEEWATVFDLMSKEEQQLANADREAFSAFQKEKGWFKYLTAEVGEAAVENDLGWVQVAFTTGLRQYPEMPPQVVKTWDVWLKTDDWRPLPRALLDQYPTRPAASRPAADEAQLTTRVDALWKARAAQDWAAVYDLLDPSYRRHVSKDEFLQRKAKYLTLSHRTEWVEVTQSRARCKVAFVQKLNDPTLYKLEPTDQIAFETWVKVDEQWFRLMEQPRGSH